MYFPTSEHYFQDDSQNSQNSQPSQNCDNTTDEKNDCLICLEINDKSDNVCIKIQNQIYVKSCLCDGWVHEYCLDIWYVKNKKCPICLSSMYKKQLVTTNVIIITEETIPNGRLCNRENLFLALRVSFLVIFLYNFIFIFAKILEIVL
jgi:hypothetical protein